MKLFDLFKKSGEKEDTQGGGDKSDMRELEIYSGMRVVVETPDGRLLFIARLHDPGRSRAELFQYSDGEIFRDTGAGALQENGTFHVTIRGYNDRSRKAVLMEGDIAPKARHTWQVECLSITNVENERSFSRLSTDLEGTVTAEGGTEEKPCRLFDISAGGASIGSGYRYHKGDRVFLKTKLSESGSPFVLYCEVLRVVERGPENFEYGCHFLELTRADQEFLVKSIAHLGEKNG